MSDRLSDLVAQRAEVEEQIRLLKLEGAAKVRAHLSAARDLMLEHQITALDVTKAHRDLLLQLFRLASAYPVECPPGHVLGGADRKVAK